MAKKTTTTPKTVIKPHKRSGSGAMAEKASNTGKFAAELSPKVKPPKTDSK